MSPNFTQAWCVLDSCSIRKNNGCKPKMNHIFWATGHILLKPFFTVNSIITGQLLSLQAHLGEGVLALRLRFAPHGFTIDSYYSLYSEDICMGRHFFTGLIPFHKKHKDTFNVEKKITLLKIYNNKNNYL